jgi:hypothetical protein
MSNNHFPAIDHAQQPTDATANRCNSQQMQQPTDATANRCNSQQMQLASA